jgi:hypothetical protein
MRTALALVILFVVITPAAADIVLQSSPGSPLPAGNLVQYTIRAVGTQGETITAFRNPSITPLVGSLGIHNVAQGLTNANTPTKDQHDAVLWNADWTPYDTYYLLNDDSLIPEEPFLETNDGATTGMLGLTNAFGSVGPPRSGYGNYSNSGIGAIKGVPPADQDSSVPFMQVVLRAQDSALLDIRVDALGSFREFQVFLITTAPVVIDDVNLDTGAAIIRHTFLPTSGDPPITWSVAPLSGSPAVAATITSTGEFEWHTIGSDRFPHGITYKWTITATNAAGSDTAELTVRIIPEPATGLLATVCGLACLSRRRKI